MVWGEKKRKKGVRKDEVRGVKADKNLLLKGMSGGEEEFQLGLVRVRWRISVRITVKVRLGVTVRISVRSRVRG